MAKYRKRPVVVEAVLWDGGNSREINDFVTGSCLSWSSDEAPCIHTLEGMMRAEPGDWIIKGVKGEFYPCKDEVFRLTYEPADAATS